MRNDIAILNAQNIAQGPVAIIRLPLKFKLGFHGNWVDQREIDTFGKLRAVGEELGPAEAAKSPLPWQVQDQQSISDHNGPNGTNGISLH